MFLSPFLLLIMTIDFLQKSINLLRHCERSWKSSDENDLPVQSTYRKGIMNVRTVVGTNDRQEFNISFSLTLSFSRHSSSNIHGPFPSPSLSQRFNLDGDFRADNDPHEKCKWCLVLARTRCGNPVTAFKSHKITRCVEIFASRDVKIIQAHSPHEDWFRKKMQDIVNEINSFAMFVSWIRENVSNVISFCYFLLFFILSFILPFYFNYFL